LNFDKVTHPREGQVIKVSGAQLSVPTTPIIPFIEGDGIGLDIMKASRRIWDAAVKKVYANKKKIVWLEIYAGQKAKEKYGEWLPKDTLEAIKYYKVAIKGPLTTPIGGGFRSLNVTMRQKLDLYACVRPVYYFDGIPSPVVHPEKMDMVIFRENTEDVYAGIEWQQGSKEVKKVIKFLKDEFDIKIRKDSGIGIKPISITGTQQLVRKAIQYAIKHGRKSVTIVHKGNIMKFTEGAFRDWAYQLAKEEFGAVTMTEQEFCQMESAGKKIPKGKIIIKDRIADSMFQQVLTRPDEYEVIALPNLNGDYLSDACAAQIGGLGMAPGGNLGDEIALFEPTHGTAPKYANQDKVNPCALILSGVMMLEHLGWDEASLAVKKAIAKTIKEKKVTYDLARLIGDVAPLSTSAFASAVIENL
jgi:isocitrate dehydrogenase